MLLSFGIENSIQIVALLLPCSSKWVIITFDFTTGGVSTICLKSKTFVVLRTNWKICDGEIYLIHCIVCPIIIGEGMKTLPQRPKKDHKTILTEYVRDLSDDDLIYLGVRLNERVGSDLAEILNFMSRKTSADYVLSSSDTAYGLYDTLDLTLEVLNKEADKRKISFKS